MANAQAAFDAQFLEANEQKSGPTYVIIGNGIAGVTAAEILRAEDAAADITVIADDPFPVYYRPALKDYLAGRVHEDKLWARPGSFYQDHRIRFLFERVMGIQAGQHSVQLQSGRSINYTRLLLANGARASRLTCPGADLTGVTTLRTVADYQEVLSRLQKVRRVVVSGSGTLALETIETLRHRGYSVIHLLRRRTLWSEVLDATASDLALQQERRDGVEVIVEEEIAEITGKNGQVSGVVTTRGTRIPCDMVIIAIGVEPIIDFIKKSGIGCGRGVQVDKHMRTNAPDIYAAGDVLETTNAAIKRTRVIGQWYPAVQQARAAAYSMLGLLDTERVFRSDTFYNATFLYGLDFACVGLTQKPKDGHSYQELVADPQPRTYRKVILKDGVVVGILALGDRKGVLPFKRAIDSGVNLTPVVSRLFASDFKLNVWLDKQGVPPTVLSVNRVESSPVKAAVGVELPVEKPLPATDALLIPIAQADGVQFAAPNLAETLLSRTKTITIGRQAGSYLLIDHSSVSRSHAEITYADGHYVLHDLGSANGTFVNHTRLAQGSTHMLKHDDQIQFGKVPFAFRERRPEKQSATPAPSVGSTVFHQMLTGFYDPLAGHEAPPPSGQPLLNADGSLLLPGAAKAVPAAVMATLQACPALIVVGPTSSTSQGNRDPEVLLLKRGKRITLGRDKKNDLVLAEVSASRKHAEVFPGTDGFYIRDLGSANGVVVNQTKIDNPYHLAHGDRITIGSLTIYFFEPGGQVSVPPAGMAPARGATTPQQGRVVAPLAGAIGVDSKPVCPNCGASNRRGVRFCAKCGTPMQATDPSN